MFKSMISCAKCRLFSSSNLPRKPSNWKFGVGAAAVGTALAAGFLYSKQAEPSPLDSLAEIKDATVIFVLGGPGKF